MEITEKQYEMVQRYLDGKMSAAEQQAFLQEVEADTVLKEHLLFEQELEEDLLLLEVESGFPNSGAKESDFSITSQPDERIAQMIRAAGTQKQDNNTGNTAPVATTSNTPVVNIRRNKTRWWYLSAVASILVIISVALWLNQPPAGPGPDDINVKSVEIPRSGPDYTDLYKRFYVKDPAPQQKPTVLKAVLDRYDQGSYYTAQHLDVERLAATATSDGEKQLIRETGYYYKGLAFLETGNTTEAIKHLRWVMPNSKDKQLVVKAQWYLSLAYLKENNKQQVLALLDSIGHNSEAGQYASSSEQLKKALTDK